MSVEVTVLRGEAVLKEHRVAWEALFAKVVRPQAFWHPSWLEVWHETMDGGRVPVVLVLKDAGGGWCGLWPFVEVPGLFGCGLWPMSFHTADAFEPLLAETGPEMYAALAGGLEALLGEYAFVWLPLVPEGFWEALNGVSNVRVSKAARVRPVSERWQWREEKRLWPLGEPDKKARYARRQLERWGEVRFERLETREAVEAFVPRLRWVERQSWKHSEGKGLFALPGARECYGQGLPALAERGLACVEVLHVGAEVAACQVGLLAPGYYGLHDTVYHPAFAECSPGAQLLALSMYAAHERGVRCYDFMQGGQDYKQRLANHREVLLEITLFAGNLVGLAHRVLLGSPGRKQRCRKA